MTRVRDSIFVALHRWFLPSSHVTTRAELCTPRKIANLWLFTVFVDATTWKTNFNMCWVEFRWNTVSKNTHDINLVKLFQNKIKHTYVKTGKHYKCMNNKRVSPKKPSGQWGLAKYCVWLCGLWWAAVQNSGAESGFASPWFHTRNNKVSQRFR